MLLINAIKRLTVSKVAPFAGKRGKGRLSLKDDDEKEFEVIRGGDYTPVKPQIHDSAKIKRVLTNVRDQAGSESKGALRRQTRAGTKSSLSNSVSTAASSTSDDTSSAASHDSAPRKMLGDVFAPFKGTHILVDRYLHALEKVEDVIWSSLIMDDVTDCSSAQFSPLDPSTVPPPDARFASRIMPVEALLRAMILMKETEQYVKRDARALEVLSVVHQEILASKDRQTSGTWFINDQVRTFLDDVFSLVFADPSQTNNASFFDSEILARLSSVIRYHLRFALNPTGKFSPIVLASVLADGSRSAKGLGGIFDSRDVPRPELNIAALLHRALFVLHEGLGESFDIQSALLYRSAKKFITNVLACADRIENVDEKRKKSWHAVQRWARELIRVFPNEMCELQLLGDLADLRRRLTLRNPNQEIAMVEMHRAALKNQRSAGADLRSSRTAMTGLVGKNGLFPEVAFILDA